jgi:alkylhydroperoxidase family enzyme
MPRMPSDGVVPVRGAPADSPIPAVPYAQLPAQLRAELAGRVERLGYLGAFFSLTAHQPEPLLHFTRFTEALKAALPGRLSEVVALSAASAAGSEYELVQHIRLARANGSTDAWIRAVTSGAGASGGEQVLRTEEQDVLALVWAATSGAPADREVRAVVARLGAPAAVAVLLLLGRYIAHGLISEVLGLGPPVTLDPPLDVNPLSGAPRKPLQWRTP